MGGKLDLRTAKFHIIGTSEPAPEVGSISDKKDTLFIKQVSATEFEVYASDDKGKVVRLEKGVNEAKFKEFLFRYINENIGDFRNILNFGKKTKEVYVSFRDGLDSAKIKLVKSDGLEFEFDLKESKKLCVGDGDRVYVDGSAVDSGYMTANGVVYGSNIGGLIEVPVDKSLLFGKLEDVHVEAGECLIVVDGLDDGKTLSVDGVSLVNGVNKVERGVKSIEYNVGDYGYVYVKNSVGDELYNESGSGTLSVELESILYISLPFSSL